MALAANLAQINFWMRLAPTDTLFNYIENASTTATVPYQTLAVIPASTSNYAVNLATLLVFPTAPIAVGWVDLTGTSLNWGMASGGTRFSQNPFGFAVMRLTTGTLPTIYFDNASGSPIDLQIFALGN